MPGHPVCLQEYFEAAKIRQNYAKLDNECDELALRRSGELAAELGEVLGREVKAQAIPREAWSETSQHMGLPQGGTWAYEQMIEGVNSGWIAFGVENTERVEGTTSAKEVFAAANAAK